MNELLKDLDLLKSAIINFSASEIIKILSRRIAGFNHDRELIDGILISSGEE